MQSVFAYLVVFLCVVYAVILHRLRARDFWLPCVLCAVFTAATALFLFQFIDPKPVGTSYLQITAIGLFFSFLLATLIGYFLKVLPNLFD